IVRVKALDQWGNPALDGQLGVETSLGQLIRTNNEAKSAALSSTTPSGPPVGQPKSVGTQLVVQTESGEAGFKLVGSGAPGEARLRAQTREIQADGQVRIMAETRPTILVVFAEMSFGKSIPEVGLRGEQGDFRRRLSFFYSGRLFADNMLTLSYATQRPINRTAGRDILFQLHPLAPAHPLFAASSTPH